MFNVIKFLKIPKWRRLDEHATGKDNNFNLLRLIAAAGVLVSHAWPLSLGAGATQPLQQTLGGMTLGTVCVLIFFAISGFFITKSYLFSKSWQNFLLARVLRVFPALFVVLVITVLVAGMIFTTADHDTFWRNAPMYILRNLSLFRLDYSLPGVFENNPYGTAINGSLWTLFYEVVCYIGVFFAGVTGLLHRPRLFGLSLVLVIIICLVTPHLQVPTRLQSLANLALPFAIGSGLFMWRAFIPLSPWIATVLGGIAWATADTEIFHAAFIVALVYFVFVIGYWPAPKLQAYNRLGDYSYGLYIYAFPVQQIFASLGVINPYINIFLSLPVTLIFAVLSWHFVEEVALSWKNRPISVFFT